MRHSALSFDHSKLHGRLASVRQFCTTCRPEKRVVVGSVEVEQLRICVLTTETGQVEGSAIKTTNTYRWTLSDCGNHLHLAHLRFGPKHPVDLVSFDLTNPNLNPDGLVEYRSIAPHICDKDEYHATITLGCGDIILQWRIIGPQETQTITSRYSPDQLPDAAGSGAGSHVVKM